MSFQLLLLVWMTALTAWVALDVRPDLHESAALMRGERRERERKEADENKRAKALADVRDRQILNEATLMLRQEQNLKLAKELNKALNGGD